ncbi:MAG: alpha/beta hydrolase family protein [Candidatus Acidiferrales bacterium]
MNPCRYSALAFVLMSVTFSQSSQSIAPQTVEISNGNLHLRAFLWKPAGPGPFPAVLFNHGSGEVDAAHTAGMPITEAAERLAPTFVKHGYAFLYLFRRGQGLSADQAPFLQDVLRKEEATKGKQARQHLQFILLTTDQLDDVLAALSFLKEAPGIDSHRIALAGHSFGGQLTLLAAETDSSVRAAVTFGAAANSWERSLELRERLLTAVRSTTAAVMLIHAANDYDTTAGRALSAELDRMHRPHVLKIYPPVGQTSDDGHNAVYQAIPLWEDDVFAFLDQYVKR